MHWYDDALVSQRVRSLVSASPDDRARWLSARRKGVGASDAPVVMGLSKYKSPRQLWDEKLGLAPEDPTNLAQAIGLLSEFVIGPLYGARFQVGLVRAQEMIFHPELPFLFCNPDFLHDDALVQCKVSGSWDGWGKDGTDQIPDAYNVQVQVEMACCGASRCDVAALICGVDFRVYPIHFNPPLFEVIAEGCRDFWERVQKRSPPPHDYRHPTTVEYLERLYPPEPVAVEMQDERFAETCDAYLALGEAISTFEAERAAERARLVEMMGPAERATTPAGHRVSRGKAFRVYPPKEKKA